MKNFRKKLGILSMVAILASSLYGVDASASRNVGCQPAGAVPDCSYGPKKPCTWYPHNPGGPNHVCL